MTDTKKLSVLDTLRASNFGQRVAEEEADDLHKYFVETDIWSRLLNGSVDIVYGPKGSGKSALYSLLVQNTDLLFDKGVLLVSGEKPRGAPAFRNIIANPPDSEETLTNLWKIYILTLVGKALSEFGISGTDADRVQRFLQDEGLAEKEASITNILSSAYEYVRGFFTREVEAIEGGLDFDTVTQLPTGINGKITFREPGDKQRRSGFASVSSLFASADRALTDQGFSAWILLDRLDVAFADHPDLESNALRALFRAYLELSEFGAIRLKVFLRTDIWKRITDSGFREASHITRHVTISWSDAAIRNLIVRRLLKNQSIIDYYGSSSEDVLLDVNRQSDFFFQVFPKQVDIGEKKPNSFDWMLSRTHDGTKLSSPREIIHFINSIRDVQIKRIETGHDGPDDPHLFERQSFKDALPDVSTVRLEQTLYAEYPDLKPYIERLRGGKASQSVETLSGIWKLNAAEAESIVGRLIDVGFFERRKDRNNLVYWVPFLYRDALELSQGSADQ